MCRLGSRGEFWEVSTFGGIVASFRGLRVSRARVCVIRQLQSYLTSRAEVQNLWRVLGGVRDLGEITGI